MAGDLRRWDDDYVDELCDIVFGQFLLGNFAEGVPSAECVLAAKFLT